MRCVASLLAQSCVLCLCTRVAGYAPAHNGVRAARPGPTTTTPTVPPAPRARTAAATTKPGAERRSVARRQDAGGKILGTIDRMINLQGDLYQMRGWVRGPHTAAARPSDLVRNPRHPRVRVRTINFSPACNHGKSMRRMFNVDVARSDCAAQLLCRRTARCAHACARCNNRHTCAHW